MSMNRIFVHLGSRRSRCCPDCVRRHNHEQALEFVHLECARVERLVGGILEFWLPTAEDLHGDDADQENRELSFIWHARVKPVAIDATAVETLDVAGFVVSELERLARIYYDAVDCIKSGDVYLPPPGTLSHDDKDGDVPAEGGAP